MRQAGWLDDPTTRLRLIGYSSWPARQLLGAVLAGRPAGDLPGDFVLVATRGPTDEPSEHLIATSVVAVRPYFVVDAPGPARHGTDVFDLVTRAGLHWSWDMEAVQTMTLIGHTVDDQSLHPRVRRVPPASVLRHDGQRWSVRAGRFWPDLFQTPRVPLEHAVDVFDEVTDELLADGWRERPTPVPLVSLSAGFDSRALLARVLAVGRQPETITMGTADSTDMVVARGIAEAFGLPHQAVSLPVNEYFAQAPTIVRLTGGSKTIAHWHPYLYTRCIPAGQLHLVGANGEFARTVRHWDRGLLARLVARGRRFSVYGYWVARLTRRYRRLAPFLPFLAPDGMRDVLRLAAYLSELGNASANDGLEIMDRYYATQRVRHFIGNGLALSAAHGDPVSPFLDARWISAVAGLRRRDRMGSNLHRRIIERNQPGLLAHPIGGRPVRPVAPVGYWLARRAPVVPYSPVHRVIGAPAAREILYESPYLDLFASRAQRHAAVTADSVTAQELLLTLHFAAAEAAAATGTGAARERPGKPAPRAATSG